MLKLLSAPSDNKSNVMCGFNCHEWKEFEELYKACWLIDFVSMWMCFIIFKAISINGVAIVTLARAACLNYKHGTWHGIVCYLSVYESINMI